MGGAFKMTRILCQILAALLLLMSDWSAVCAQSTLPQGWQTKGEIRHADSMLIAQERATIAAPLQRNETCRIDLRLGKQGAPFQCRVETKSGRSMVLQLTATSVGEDYHIEPVKLPPDGCVKVQLTGQDNETLFDNFYYVRPHPRWYFGKDRERALAQWQTLPGASQRTLELRIEVYSDRVGIWLDDRYVGGQVMPDAATLNLQLSPGNALGGVAVAPLNPHRDSFVPIATRGYSRTGTLKIESTPLKRGAAQLVDQVPFVMAGEGDEINVGRARWLGESVGADEFTDIYYSRTAFDRRPEDILLAIPTDDYSYTHLLCVVDPDPEKTPAVTLRLTRYLKDIDCAAGGRGDAIADTTIRLEKLGGNWPAGCRPVGNVTVRTPQGEKTLPLLHVAIPLKSGEIQDVLDERGIVFTRSTQLLDLELTKELHAAEPGNHGTHSLKPLGKPSGVYVCGLTLERSPVKARLRAQRIGQIFYASEKPALVVEVSPRGNTPFQGKLISTITDFYGRRTVKEQAVAVSGSARSENARIDVAQPGFGWFGAELQLRDRTGRPIWSTTTSFAVLPPETRKAGRESPYGTWWFRANHGGSSSIDEIGPLFERLGVRHTCPSNAGPDGKTLAKHSVSLSMYPWWVGGELPGLDAMISEHRGVGKALIFHETNFGETIMFPPEFIGKSPAKLTAEQERRFKECWDSGIAWAKHIRQKHPDVKLILGNGSLPFLVELLRRGYPREYVDLLGDEDLGQQIMPEAPPAADKSLFWTKQYAKLYKYDVPLTSCFEWRGRGTAPGCLTELEQAQLYTRDVLHGLAYRMPNINPALLHDVADCYYYSRWGSVGLCRRYPLLNPKMSYVAVSTLTRQLDGAKFQRSLSAGSPSIYAMEFAKGDRLVYALWLPRGERKATVTFPKDATFTLTDMNGNSRTVATQSLHAQVSISASPSYLETPVAVSNIDGGPTVCGLPPKSCKTVDPLTSLDRWQIVRESDGELDTCHFSLPRQVGAIDVEPVIDAQRRHAIQFTLRPQPTVPWPVARYVRLRHRDGIPIAGRPNSLGLWVRGNSCWGRVFWEFKDAKGETFRSIGALCGGWNLADWKSETFINFDGWNYLSADLPFKYASGYPGPKSCDWAHTGGDGLVDFPIRLTGVVVELRDRVVHLTEPVPVIDRSIRLSDLTAAYDMSSSERRPDDAQ
jgi:hypothetical protein